MVIAWHRPDVITWFMQVLKMDMAGRAASAHPEHGVFIVEDHAGMRRALTRLVKREPNFRVTGEAASAEEALERVAVDLPAVMLVDINLPGMNGIELIAHVTREYPGIRCVVVSAYADSGRVSAAMSAGARAFVSKDEPHMIAKTLAEVAATQ